MAVKKSTSTKSKSKKQTKQLNEQLVLNKFFLNLFGASDFAKDFDYLKDERLEGYDQDTGCSKFILEIINRNISKISSEQLKKYDNNIRKHTTHINLKRDKKIVWKYFQYLSILFVEIYLDWYFSNKEGLVKQLNDYIIEFNNKNNTELSEYKLDELKKIALWNATGSGKTLVMHVNILQYRYYVHHYNKTKELNKIIILTPNEGLSNQHLSELKKSNIRAGVFSDEINLFTMNNKDVNIIDLHKIRRKKGEKTVALDSFEKNNFVLIDEGHIGISSGGSSDLSWNEIRTTMSQDGFCIEYSATFGQAVDSKGKDGSLEEYSKSILFDYSYKYFYKDGYGKDYRILNMSDIDNNENDNKFKYLVGSLLTFYQQLKLYNTGEFNLFNIHEPLMIFVGSKVTAVRSEKGKKVSDIVDILLFLKRFIENNNNESVRTVENILKGKSGLYSGERDLFFNKLPYLNKLYTKISIEELYKDIFKQVFNSDAINGVLKLENLKACNGEIALTLGENVAFGVINVGDTNELIKLCESNELRTIDNDFQESLFNNIKDKDSRVKILIGSKKFTEGWDSWRVSAIGLMNIGKKEGSQIIQLFGRGIRLQGYNMSLKRTSALGAINIGAAIPEYISTLETLNIFGINANYMKEFRDMLLKEDVPPNDEKIDIKLPILPTIESDELKKLKVIRVKDNMQYKRNAEKEVLDNNISIYFKENKIKLDLYANIDEVQSKKDRGIGTLIKENVIFNKLIISIMDMDRVFFEIVSYKKDRCLYNINIAKEYLVDLLLDDCWYEIYMPKADFRITFANKTRFEDVAIMLLQKYLERFFKKKKAEWEKDKLEYVELTYNEFIKSDSYNIEINANQHSIIENISELKNILTACKNTGDIKSISYEKYSDAYVKFIGFDRHVYNPLIAVPTKIKDIKISPIELNSGEAQFVEALKDYVNNEKDRKLAGKEIYLIRNSVGNVGFFEEGNFYPDFIMWIIDDEKEYITFIDPKGMRNVGLDSSKVMLYKKIKEYEKLLNINNTGKPVILNSFILSVTSIDELAMLFNDITKEKCEDRNVFFLKEEEDNIYMINGIIDKVLYS